MGRILYAIWYFVHLPIYEVMSFFERRRSLRSYIVSMKRNGTTKLIFDMDRHTIVIQSHKHVEDNSA